MCSATAMMPGRRIHWSVALLIALIIVFVQLLTGFFTGGQVAAASQSTADPRPILSIYFFHNNPCESCQIGFKFQQQVSDTAQAEGLDKKIIFNVYEYKFYRQADQARLLQLFGQYQVSDEYHQFNEYIFTGTSWLGSKTDIDLHLAEVLRKETEILLADQPSPTSSEPAATGSEPANGANGKYLRRLSPSSDTWLYYFYTSPCDNCEQVADLLDSLGQQVQVVTKNGPVMSDLQLVRQNIAAPEGLIKARMFFSAWSVPEADQKVPVLFIGDRYLSGSEAILATLPDLIKGGQGLFQAEPIPVDSDSNGMNRLLTGYEVAGVFLTGLVNGFNPCSLSMLLFFISLLMARGVNLLKFGLSFLAGKFISYLVLGTVSYRLLQYLDGSWFHDFQQVLKIILVIILISLAVANLSDSLAARSERYNRIRMQLPLTLRKKNHVWLKKLASVSDPRLLLLVSFLAGSLISIGEFLCTGQIYLATILYVLNVTGTFSWQAAGYFLLYVVGIVLPLVVLTVILHKGKAMFLVSEAVRRQMPVVKLVSAMIFLAFAAITWFVF
jgi:cytochrome c biogenesis protein CcdA